MNNLICPFCNKRNSYNAAEAIKQVACVSCKKTIAVPSVEKSDRDKYIQKQADEDLKILLPSLVIVFLGIFLALVAAIFPDYFGSNYLVDIFFLCFGLLHVVNLMIRPQLLEYLARKAKDNFVDMAILVYLEDNSDLPWLKMVGWSIGLTCLLIFVLRVFVGFR